MCVVARFAPPLNWLLIFNMAEPARDSLSALLGSILLIRTDFFRFLQNRTQYTLDLATGESLQSFGRLPHFCILSNSRIKDVKSRGAPS